MWIWRRMEHAKWTDKIRNAVVLERVREGRIMLELIKKRKINWLGHWLTRNCLLKDALEGRVKGKKVRGRRRYQMIDNIMINGLYEDTKYRAMIFGRKINKGMRKRFKVKHISYNFRHQAKIWRSLSWKLYR